MQVAVGLVKTRPTLPINRGIAAIEKSDDLYSGPQQHQLPSAGLSRLGVGL